MTYDDVYKKRLNRFGNDLQSRIQGQREYEFEDKLRKSVYRVEFKFEELDVVATLEPYKQDTTETLQYLLTRVNVELPAGAILMIPNKDGIEKPWLVYYLENMKASGYNRYILLKMTHYLKWTARTGTQEEAWAYFKGKGKGSMRDSTEETDAGVLIFEDSNDHTFICAKTHKIKKDDYFIVGEKPYQEQFRVTGYDIQSTPGVEYVTVDPVYEYDTTPAPEKTENDDDEDFYWLEGSK